MKVLLVAHHLPPRHRAGVEVHTLRLAHALRDQGCAVALYAADDQAHLRPWSVAHEVLEGIPCWRLAHPRLALNPQDSLGGRHEHAAFERVLDEVEPDVVHFQHLMYVGVDAPVQAARRGLPTVLTLHEYWLLCARGGQMRREDGILCASADPVTCASCLCTHRFGRGRLEMHIARWSERVRKTTGMDLFKVLKRVLEARLAQGVGARQAPSVRHPEAELPAHLDAAPMAAFLKVRAQRIEAAINASRRLLCPSRFLRDQFVAAWPDMSARLLYWPNGVPQPSERPKNYDFDHTNGPNPKPLRVGFLGSIIPEKGVDVLVKAFADLPSGSATLKIHGSQQIRPRYVAEMKRLSAVDVQWAGVFSGSPSTALAAMDVLVVPSVWYENAPLVIAEAFAAGVPVVASDLGGMRELVQHGENGMLFPMGDAAALAACIKSLAYDRTLLERLAAGTKPPRSVIQEAAASMALYAELRSE